jgi:hypothetical protein
MDEFISDIRALDKLEKFEGGIPAERDKANAIVSAFNSIKDAADRQAIANANNADGLTITCVFNGGLTDVFFPGAEVV